MKTLSQKFYSSIIFRSAILSIAAFVLTGCGDDRGGVIVDASGEQGGGSQPGGGGFAFVVLFVVVAGCVLSMFAMDRIKKNREDKKPEDK